MTDGRRPPLGLVVPVFDEAARLGDYGKILIDFVAQLPVGSKLLFVDDGSADDTPDLIDDLLAEMPGTPARLLRRPHVGKGAAVTAGLCAMDTPLLGFCDLDLSTPLEDLERIAASAVRADALAIGSRDLTTSTLVRAEGALRETLGRAYNRLLQAVVTPGVVDTQCGAKVAPCAVWDAVLPHCREVGFAWDAEVIAVAQALGIAVVEVPVNWCHDERSKVNVGRDGAAMVAATPRIWRSAQRAVASRSTVRRPPATPTPAVTASGAATLPRTEVYDDANAAVLAGSDDSHWWYRSKAALVTTALRRTASPRAEPGWLVDVGGGSGGVTAMLGWPLDRVVLLEGNQVLATHARRRHGLAALRTSVQQLPLPDGTAEVVCLLDVIEHLHDPVAALCEAARVLAPHGRLVVNVPAHQWLWSAFDDQVGHLRRYTRSMLRAELAGAGLEPLLLSHVFGWLAPPMWLKRKLLSGGAAEFGLDQTSFAIDRAAMALTFAERTFLGRASLPIGTSVLCIAARERR